MRTYNELNDLYLNWMYQLVDDSVYTNGKSYLDLFYLLRDIPFTYELEMDKNRLDDGLDLRYRFGEYVNYSRTTINRYFKHELCSVLEMMIALAIRLEEHIMYDSEFGDRTAKWFWSMIDSLGLSCMDDSNFDEEYSYDAIMRWLDRDYESNGEGGLFTIEKTNFDLREVEIWYQACWYLNQFKEDLI